MESEQSATPTPHEPVSVQKDHTSPSGDDLELRKEAFFSFLREKWEWITYAVLAFFVYLSVHIRTKNIPLLKDVTTGDWTLGPDLDPFLFLRWAQDIVANGGSLPVWDMMRYVPLGFNTAGEMKLLSYLIAWFHYGLQMVMPNTTVTYSAILFPVFMFALTVITFFLFARKTFAREEPLFASIVALVASFFFLVMPSLLARTIAGIPEKESASFFFIFLALYFFLESFETKARLRAFIFGALAGITTGSLALVWGGSTFVFMSVAGAVLLYYLLGGMTPSRMLAYAAWILFSFPLMMSFSTRYSLGVMITSTSTGSALVVLVLFGVHLLLSHKAVFRVLPSRLRSFPRPLVSLGSTALLGVILSSLFFGIGFIFTQIRNIFSAVIHPLNVTRFGLTVAENRQPFFISDWQQSFGPVIANIPLYFWLFFFGAIALFALLVKPLRAREKILLVGTYTLFLFSLIFSKYSSSSILNGDTTASFIVYFGGVLLLAGVIIRLYWRRYKKKALDVLATLDFNLILYFVLFTMTLIGARGAIRLIMVLGAVSPIAAAFIMVRSGQLYLLEKNEARKLVSGLVALLVILSGVYTGFVYYQSVSSSAGGFGPSSYHQQWQQAMAWVRENTPQDAVFAHWWDYGYWVQSIGERATILDGGNQYVYWNHLMGRHVLTGGEEETALEFLYAHNGTHLLIDSTELGKYTAYSSIGSDEDYDRFAWIPIAILDERQTQETNNQTIYVYSGGSQIDEDIIWEVNGREMLFPRRDASVIGFLLPSSPNGSLSQPQGIYFYQGQQHTIPLRYLYLGEQLLDFGDGLDAGLMIIPRVAQQGSGQISIAPTGAAVYLSPRTIDSRIAQLYLFDQPSDYFELVHAEPNAVVSALRSQGGVIGDFLYFNGFQGPIKIWEISYPEDTDYRLEFLETEFPYPELYIAKPGEY